MNNENYVVYEGILLPEPALLKQVHRSKYGTLPDLSEDELADPDELEKQVYKEELGPVLSLPVKNKRSQLWHSIESGHIDFGAFATVDFERTQPEFDKARYKADRLKEKLQDLIITFSIVSERMPCKAKYKVLKLLRMGIISKEHIANDDMLALAQLYFRILKLKQEISELKKASMARKQRKLKAFLESI
jgi:hypothetical protein